MVLRNDKINDCDVITFDVDQKMNFLQHKPNKILSIQRIFSKLTAIIFIASISAVNFTVTFSAFADAFASLTAEFAWPTSIKVWTYFFVRSILAVIATVALLLSWDAGAVSALELILSASWMKEM